MDYMSHMLLYFLLAVAALVGALLIIFAH
jgi:hypothetical protein